jgi:hypothetical protein
MTPADLTLPTPTLAVLPPRRRTGARVEPWISGVTAVEGNKLTIGPTLRSAKIWIPEGPGTHNPILSEPIIALRTAIRSIIRSTPGSKMVRSLFVFLLGLS